MTTTFLICGLLFPRLTLLVAYLNDNVPANDVPFSLDVASTIFAPRLLLAYYSYFNDVHMMWSVLYVATFLTVVAGQRQAATSRK